MYDYAVTARQVDAANARFIASQLNAAPDVQPQPLQYHSHATIQAAVGYFRDLWDYDAPKGGRLKRPLTREEQLFIENERILCALDFRNYWLPHYARIIDWEKKPSHFVPNVAQSIIIDLWGESESKGHAIWMQQLKARQLGVSTLSELAVQHRFQFMPYTDAVIASADPDKSVKLAGMMKYSHEQQPWYLVPTVTKWKNFVPAEFGEIHSKLTIEAGNQYHGVGRGSTPNVIHLSELAEWEGAEDLIEGGLLPAIHDTPNVFGILESTAKGGGYWKNKWESSKRDYPRGVSRMRPVFLPWFVGTDLYPTPADMRQRPCPPSWIPADHTIRHAEKARQFVLSDPLLFTHLAKGDSNWTLPRHQAWWWEMEYDQAKADKRLHVFLAEFCGDDFTAFQSSNVPVIDPEVLLNYQERTRPPHAVYTIIGPDIPPALVTAARHFDTEKPTITIRTKELLPSYNATYQLVPLKFTGYNNLDPDLKFIVYEPPQIGHLYGMGTDCAEGLGQDNSTLQVMREATVTHPPALVAEWASNLVTAFQMWPLVMAIANWYSVFSYKANARRQMRVAIENATNGSALQHELQKRGWSNFHPWQYNDKRNPKVASETPRMGVITNFWWRSLLFDQLLTVLGEEAIDIPSPYLVQELVTLERDPATGKPQAAAGEHDDRVLAMGHILLSLHMNKPALLQHQRQRVAYVPGLEHQPVTDPVWTPPDQGRLDHGRWVPQPGQAAIRIGGGPGALVRHVRGQQVTRGVNGQPELARIVNDGMPVGYR